MFVIFCSNYFLKLQYITREHLLASNLHTISYISIYLIVSHLAINLTEQKQPNGFQFQLLASTSWFSVPILNWGIYFNDIHVKTCNTYKREWPSIEKEREEISWVDVKIPLDAGPKCLTGVCEARKSKDGMKLLSLEVILLNELVNSDVLCLFNLLTRHR